MNNPLPLFDCNGRFGPTAFMEPEYRQITDLLAQLDRLGVSRSLVWHAAGRDLHPNTGNRKLIQAIESLGAAADRFVPAFAVSPCMLYERNGLTELTEAVRSGRVRALRLFPNTLRHSLNQIEPVIAAVAESRPVLLCDLIRESPSSRDVLDLAERFPSLPLVLTQGMWPSLPMVLDLMTRRENIFFDLSWLHVNRSIEMICQRFGAQRLLFGLGLKTHHGAAIAALHDAEIDEPSRHLIAHGNLEKLLGLSTSKPVSSGLSRDPQKGFWNALVSGQKPAVEIVDAHGHLGPLGMWMIENQEIEHQAPAAVRDMDRCGIRATIVSGMDALFSDPVEGNRLIEEKARPYGDRFRGWLVFNPIYHRQLEPLLDEFFARPFFAGFKLLNDYWRIPVTDPRFEAVWKHADRHRLPILLHTWEGPFNSPALLKNIAPAHPNAIFVLGHSGGGDPGRREAEALALANPNVYLEWCGSFLCSIPWEETIARVGASRVLFGSDAVVHSYAWELGRLLSQDIPDQTLRPILGDNMRAILARRLGGMLPVA